MAYLILADGKTFEGKRIGAAGDGLGEVVFTTGMTGYLETLTDPSYAGQIVVQTFPLIGNYGVIEEDFEGESAVRGYVVSELCGNPSNFRSEYALDDFLKERGIPGICGIDTRELTKTIRQKGCMNGLICDELPDSLDEIVNYAIRNPLDEVTCEGSYVLPSRGETKFRIALVDCGAKRNIAANLTKRGCEVTVLPARVKAADVLGGGYDGVMLSNGPGDPEDNAGLIAEIKQIIGRLPVFGICLGHQLTALAMGGKTEKLKYGHHGANQPVRDLVGGRTFITSQNHNYAVVADSLAGVAELTYVNANDGSCEGLAYPGLDCFTVQFHPEAAAGPLDTGFLFDRFISMTEARKNA